MRITRVCVLSLLLLIIGYLTLPASGDVAQSPFLFMEELRIGMEGLGKTTIRGDEVRSFQIRIIGLVDNPGELNDYILVRSSGDVIREIGGYAQGMSGSPIYVNDRLIGAFFAAFVFDQSPNPIGLVRPIEAMLELARSPQSGPESPEGKQNSSHRMVPSSDKLARALGDLGMKEDGQPKEVLLVSRPPSLEERRAHPDTLYAVRASTPLWVSGLSGRALDWLKRGVEPQVLDAASGLLPLPASSRNFIEELQSGFEVRYGSAIYPFAAGAAQGGEFTRDFEPGRPMAALLTQGDVLFGGVCTTSYIDLQADVLLACGHPLFLTGESSMFLAKARVIDTVNSSQISFVLPEVSRDEASGTVRQDRLQAIGASLGDAPRAVKLTAHLKDATTGNTRDLMVRIANTGNFAPSLVFSSLLQAVDANLNRIGQGTMRVDYTIRGARLPKKLERSDIFTHFSDIAVQGPLQIAQVVFLLDQNEFVDPEIERIDVDIETTQGINLLRVKSIETDKEAYQPGETVRYTVRLEAYRDEDREVSGRFQLPEELRTKRLTLYVFGGPRRQQNDSSQTPDFKDVNELIQAIERSTANDQLTVQLLGLPRERGGGEEDEDAEVEQDSPFQEVQRLGDSVVTGEERTTIEIEFPKPEEQKPEQEPETPEESEDGEECPQLFYC